MVSVHFIANGDYTQYERQCFLYNYTKINQMLLIANCGSDRQGIKDQFIACYHANKKYFLYSICDDSEAISAINSFVDILEDHQFKPYKYPSDNLQVFVHIRWNREVLIP